MTSTTAAEQKKSETNSVIVINHTRTIDSNTSAAAVSRKRKREEISHGDGEERAEEAEEEKGTEKAEEVSNDDGDNSDQREQQEEHHHPQPDLLSPPAVKRMRKEETETTTSTPSPPASTTTTTIPTKIWHLRLPPSPGSPPLASHPIILSAGRLLSLGEVVAFPTETVYGLGANAFSDRASRKIFAAKGRPADNPLIVHISDAAQLSQWVLAEGAVEDGCREVHPVLRKVADAYWPGPLSIVVPYEVVGGNKERNESERGNETTNVICTTVRCGLSSVAVRLPSSPIARVLIRAAGCPIAAPSANVSGKPSPTKGKHVVRDLAGKVVGIIDAGEVMCEVGLESTVVKMEGEEVVILRPGAVTKEMIEREVKGVRVRYAGGDVGGAVEAESNDSNTNSNNQHPEAPGMKYTHYAPEKPLFVVESLELFGVLKEVVEEMEMKQQSGDCDDDNALRLLSSSIALLISSDNPFHTLTNNNPFPLRECFGPRSSLRSVAANLFACLREFDSQPKYAGIQMIIAEAVEEEGIGVGIMNRMRKAAGIHGGGGRERRAIRTEEGIREVVREVLLLK